MEASVQTSDSVASVQTSDTVAGDAEYEQIMRRAAWLGGHGRERDGKQPLVSFYSLLLALTGGGSPTLDWFKATCRELQPRLIPRALERWRTSTVSGSTFPPDLAPEHVRNPGRLDAALPAVVDRTPSAIDIATRAAELARDTSAGVPGVRHLIAAVLLADGHREDFTAIALPYRSLLARHLAILARDAPGELPTWTAATREAFAWHKSARLQATLNAARASARARSATAVSLDDLLDAILSSGSAATSNHADAWLVSRLPGEVRDKLRPPPTSTPTPTQDPPGSPEVEAWLDVARRYALTCADDELSTRHVIAALLSPAGPIAAKRRLRLLGGEPIDLARALVALLRDHPAGDDLATWAWLLHHDVPTERRKPGYANDHAGGADLIGIDTDVRALASVLAATDTVAPLSVGLFGDWGSGKSFFMRKMYEHIEQLADRSKQDPTETAFCKDIAQVELNAWHYMDDDVWSSMVVRLLDQLDAHFARRDRKQATDTAHQSLAFLDVQRAAQQAIVDAATKDIAAYDAQLTAPLSADKLKPGVMRDAGGKVARHLADNPAVKAAVAKFEAALHVEPGTISIAGLEREQARATGALGKLALWWRETVENPTKLILTLVCAATALGLVVVASVVDSIVPTLLAAAATVGGASKVIDDVIKRARPAIAAGKAALATAERAASRIIDDAYQPIVTRRAEADQRRATAIAALARLDTEAAALRKSLEPARLSSFREFVLDRARSADYRDRQGIIALVNRDFDGLSRRLRQRDGTPTVDRIILYIDDLDRCTPKRVVEVLQAIHLMLSFDLFIVVVAVDSGWLLESLKAYYMREFPGLRMDTAEWELRPQFYLEKIFQLPYTLMPLGDDQFSRLVGGLLADSVALDGDDGPLHSQRPGTTPPPGTDDAGAAAGAAGTIAALPVRAAPPPLDLRPRNLELTQRELDFLQTLGPVVGSPRAGKRLVNLYRIVRAGLDADQLEWFVDGHFPLTQIVLAAVVGAPDVTAPWFEAILTGAIADRAGLTGWLEARAPAEPRLALIRDRVAGCIDRYDWPRVVATCTQAARYSFETGRHLARRAAVR